MSQAVKVEISLPPAVFETIESERQKRGESRGEFFRRAIQAYLRGLHERKDTGRYTQERPEPADEIREVSSIGYAGHAAVEPLVGRRTFGQDRGLFEVPDDFDDPLPADVLASFE